MSLVEGCGCWPGKASGRVVWIEALPQIDSGPVSDRQTEVNRFRAALASALVALEGWAELQTTVEGRLLAQGYQEALANRAWSRRAIGLIDRERLSAQAAARRAADTVGPLLGRSPDQAEQGRHLVMAAQAISEWLEPRRFAEDAVVAAEQLSTLALLAVGRPLLLAGVEAPAGAGPGPVVWGVPGLTPAWNGCWVSIDDCRVERRPPDSWVLYEDRLNEMPLWRIDGKPGAVPTHSAAAALISRLDDLAAVPMLANLVAAIAVDLEALGYTTGVDHPGTLLLLKAAAGAAQSAGIPFLAGSGARDCWSELGFTGLYLSAPFKEGSCFDAL